MLVKIVLACALAALCHSCTIPTEKDFDFTDFARRSQFMVIAQFNVKTTQQATFKVTKLFSKKSTTTLQIGRWVTIKAIHSKCIKFLQLKKSAKYILFLQKIPGAWGFQLQYRPVLASYRNFVLFDSVLKGTAKTGNPLEISGCAKIPAPMNGAVKCTIVKKICTITCLPGFTLSGGKTRTCTQTTGLWEPKATIKCVSNTPTTTTLAATTTPATTTKEVTTTTSPPTTRSNAVSITLTEGLTTVDSELQRLAAIWRKQQLASMAALKTTAKPVTSRIVKTTTTTPRPTTTQKSSTIPPWYRFISSPPAILKLGAPPIAHDTGNAVGSKPPSESGVEWVNDDLAVVDGKGDTFNDPHGQSNEPMLAPNNKVYGCPTYNVPVHLYSTWDGGFNGRVQFPKLPHRIAGGWLVCLDFNHELDDLQPYNAGVDVLSINKKKVCLGPKGYNTIIYENQDLFVGFIGFTERGKSFVTSGTGSLMGWCHDEVVKGKVVGKVFNTAVIKAFKNKTDTSTDEPLYTQHTDFAPSTTSLSIVAVPTGAGGLATKPNLGVTTKKKWVPTTKKKWVPTTKKKWVPTTKKKWVPTTKKRWVPTPRRGPPTRRPNLRRVPLNPLQNWPLQRCHAATPNGKVAKGGNSTPKLKVSRSKLPSSDINYDDVLHKSNLFYEAQRSGMLHASNRVPWRGHSALKDGCDIGFNLTGGWYNDEGHVKSTYPIAFAATMLSWGVIDFRDAYMQSGELLSTMSNIRWAAKYLLQCHVGEEKLVGQVGNYVRDKSDWGRAEELDVSERIVYILDKDNPSPEIVAETVAALSAASLVFKIRDPVFSKKCLSHAKQLFEFAEKYPAGTLQAIPTASTKYSPWNGANDDLAWGAAWLARATQSDYFLEKAEAYYNAIDSSRRPSRLFYWDDKTNGAASLLAKLTKKLAYKNDVKAYVNTVIDKTYRTPNKSIYLSDQAPNQHTGNAVFIALTSLPSFSSPSRKKQIKAFSAKQIGLLLGTSGRSFVVGCGANPPTRPFHMGSSCPDYPAKCTADVLLKDKNSPHILYGALVAGADKNGGYEDSIYMPSYNQVSVVINSGFQSAVAALKYYEVVEFKKRSFQAKGKLSGRPRKKSG